MVDSIETIFHQVDLQANDKVTIITDTQCESEVGELLFRGAMERGADAIWSQVNARSTHGDDLPTPVAAALQASDLGIVATSVSASYSAGVVAAIQSGVRVLSMPGVNLDMLRHGAMTADYEQVRELTERWGERFARGGRIEIKTMSGTALTADLGGWSRRPLLDCGQFPRGRGCLGNMPAGEVAVSPIEGSTRGRIVADLTLSTTRGPLTNPVVVDVEGGSIVDIQGGREAGEFEQALSRHGSSAFAVAEVALGTNSAARHIGIVIEDEKRLGTAHVGFGHAIGLGGINISGIHADAVFDNATLSIDGVPLIIEGEPTSEGMRRENLDAFPGLNREFASGHAKAKVVDGCVYASWRDLHGSTYWSQVGTGSAARAACELLDRGNWECEPGSREARICELLALYGVLIPVE